MTLKSLKEYRGYDNIYVDAMNLAVRSYRGIPDMEYKGRKTGMMYGVCRAVLDWRDRHSKVDITFLWEGRGSERKEKYPIYKSNRVYTDDRDQFFGCINDVKDALVLLGVSQQWADGYEADDLAYSMSLDLTGKSLFVSTDWDWWPLSSVADIQYQSDVLTKDDILNRFEKKFGGRLSDVSRMLIFKVLTGDSSDNVSGIPRFPKKLAIQVANSGAEDIIGIVDVLNSLGSVGWAKKVENHKWIIERNFDLLALRNLQGKRIDGLRPETNWGEDSISTVLNKFGMVSLNRYLNKGV